MKIIDIGNEKDYLELFLAKKNIEDDLIALNKLEERYTFEEFMQSFDFSSHIYVNGKTVLPFAMCNTSNEDYLFVVANTPENLNMLTTALEEIDYDFSKLVRKSQYDVSIENIINDPHFIINMELYYKE